MTADDMEHPHTLLGRLRLGREEYCQRLLTMLILEDAYPRWNSRSSPSTRGLLFLRMLDALSFGEADLPDEVEFVDELDLSSRDERPGSAPDYGVITAKRLWIIELKTEAASHRPAQLPAYAELGAHHFPDQKVGITYLTPPLAHVVTAPEPARFAHLTWEQVMPLVREVWGDCTGRVADVLASLDDALGSIGQSWGAWRGAVIEDVVRRATGLGQQTSLDGLQRAVEHDLGSLEELLELREAVKQSLEVAGITVVDPWVWRSATSGGTPLTSGGRATGYELRLSRSNAGRGAPLPGG